MSEPKPDQSASERDTDVNLKSVPTSRPTTNTLARQRTIGAFVEAFIARIFGGSGKTTFWLTGAGAVLAVVLANGPSAFADLRGEVTQVQDQVSAVKSQIGKLEMTQAAHEERNRKIDEAVARIATGQAVIDERTLRILEQLKDMRGGK